MTRFRALQIPAGGAGVAVGVLALCVASAVAYAALRLGYAGSVIGVETYEIGSHLIVYGGFFGGIGVAGWLGYTGVDAPTAILAGLALPVGISLGSLGTVALGIGRYDSSPAILFVGLLLFCCVANGVGWVLGSYVT